MRVLLVTTGSRGDVAPFVALGRGLARAGHEPLLAAPRRFAPLAEPYGVAFAGLDDSVFALQDDLVGKGSRAALTGVRRVRPLMRRWLDDLATLAAEPADLVAYAPKTLGGPHLADRMGVPSVAVLAIPLYLPTSSFPVPLLPVRPPHVLNRPSWHLAAAVEAPWRGMVRRWRRRDLRLATPAPTLARRIAAGGAVHAWSRHLLPAPPDWPATARPLGFLHLPAEPGRSPDARLARFVESGDPPVYVGFGSMAGTDPGTLTRTVTRAVRRTGRRAVLATGAGALRATGEEGAGVLTIDAAPHDWLLPRVALAVHHGGVGTVAAAMRAGVPQVIAPFYGDQPFWAHRAHALGIAPPPLRKLTEDTLSRAIHDAITLTTAAADLAGPVRAEDAVTAAVTALERAAARGPRPTV